MSAAAAGTNNPMHPSSGPNSNSALAPPLLRRFREVHYHRFVLGTRSNVHGTCLLRSELPVRLPRPHVMQLRYDHPPPGVGYRRLVAPSQWNETTDPASYARLEQEHIRMAKEAISRECEKTASWIEQGHGCSRTHVVVATQHGLQFFVAGFGYWNTLDVGLGLVGESCVGVKAFEVPAKKPERLLPTLVVALTTYIKRAVEAEGGTYKLYAIGAESLPPVTTEFLAQHAIDTSMASKKQRDSATTTNTATEATAAEKPVTAATAAVLSEKEEGEEEGESPKLAANDYAYLEERLFSLRVDSTTVHTELEYLPFRISHDIPKGDIPPVVLVAGNDNVVHRYAVGSNGIFELHPLRCPRTESTRAFTAFDARAIGPYHVQITAHQEFTVSLQASVQESPGKRRLLVADEEVYDAAPILATVFTPSALVGDHTAFDPKVSQLVSERSITAGDIYSSTWPIDTDVLDKENTTLSTDLPRVHALVGFVGEDAVVYHDVAVAGLDPVPTLVGGRKAQVPAHIAGRGGIFALPGSAQAGLISSVHFADLDFDGVREILVGTVTGAVLIYKEVPARGCYVMVWKRRFPAPVYGIFCADVNGDGVGELVVVTLQGVHILQPNLEVIRHRLFRKLGQTMARREAAAKQQETQDKSDKDNSSE